MKHGPQVPVTAAAALNLTLVAAAVSPETHRIRDQYKATPAGPR